MYYYFSSNYPAVIKLNGIYYGTIHNAVKSLRVDDEAPFVEICPLNGSENPINLLLDKDFLQSPPEQVSLTDMGGGYLLKFNGGFSTAEFKVLAQQKYSDAVVTVFSENAYKISIETRNDFFAENLDFQVNSAEIKRNDKFSDLIAVYLYGENITLNIYSLTGGISKIFSREIDSAEFLDKLVTVESVKDIAKHKITTKWDFAGGKLTATEKRVACSSDFDKEKLSEKIIPYAFLEEMMVGGDYEWYLDGIVKENSASLSGFFGEFIGVMPPPVFREVDEIGLIYSKGKNLYNVKYFTFIVKGGKIVNITC